MIIDVHAHASLSGRYWLSADEQVRSMDMYGVDKACLSIPLGGGKAMPKRIREANDDVLGAMRKHPDRLMGLCFLNPAYFRETQEELARCVDAGMVGVKLFPPYLISDPCQYPLIERCIEFGIPILMHAGSYNISEEEMWGTSTGEHFEKAARVYPEAMLIFAHIGGGERWERDLKWLRNAPSVFLDTGGSLGDAGLIERCVRDVGAERLVFGCDMSIERGLGKIMGADITEKQRKMIFGENFLKILSRRKK